MQWHPSGQLHSSVSTQRHQEDQQGYPRNGAVPSRRVIIDWAAVDKQLPVGRDRASKASRRKLFSHFDPNGNGILSLAEVDRGMKNVLHFGGASECTPAINRAFHAARDAVPPVAEFSNRYIDRNEFRFLLIYLRYYLELWEFFDMIDTSDDRRIRLREFQAAVPFFHKWKLKAAAEWEKDPTAVFQQIDRNGGGVVLFDEFADFCLRHCLHQASGEDDDMEERQEALEALRKKGSNSYGHDQTPSSLTPQPVQASLTSQPVQDTTKTMIDWETLKKTMPIGRDPTSKATRHRLFSRFDPNGNGILSLAEVDNGLKRVLHLVGAAQCTPAINRAFHAAREFAKPVASFSDDYVDKNEFRVLLVYLRHYIELWEHFNAIDTSGDRRVKFKEFQMALPLLKKWGIKEAARWDADPRAAFAKLDYNGGGVVLFDEFADFCLRHGLSELSGTDSRTDQEDRREALEALKNATPNLTSSPHHHGHATHTRALPSATTQTRSLMAGPGLKMMVDKSALEAQLPIGRDAASKQTRSKLFSRFDPNGNGVLSLAEVDKGLKQVLQLAGIEDCSPAVNRAFHAAREIAPPVSSFSNDYIDKNEFRVLFVYLRHYIELFELFSSIDTSNDRRVRLREFQAALPKMKQWGIREAKSWEKDPQGAFSLMDKNDGGMVLFDEFADFVLRLPSEAAPLDAQLRHLMEANDDLRARLALCRRDYLRELTELRERCRQLEPPVAEALRSLLLEEPVMFFEPMDFVCDDKTKDFIRLTVEEKLRLLMLKGWRKGADDEIHELNRRIQELEEENAALRNRRTGCSEQILPLGMDDEEDTDETCEGMHSRRLLSRPFADADDVEAAIAGHSQETDADDVAREFASAWQNQATQTSADSSSDAGDFSRPGSRRNNRVVSTFGTSTTGHCAIAGTTASRGQGNSTHPANQNGNRAVDGGSFAVGCESNADHAQLERKYRLLQRKFARFVNRINGNVDDEVIEKTLAEVGLDRQRAPLAEVGLDRPKAATNVRRKGPPGAHDRLYADALRRIQLLRERTAEVQALQVAELRHCSDAARDRGGKKKVEQLKGLHSKTVVCTNALHEALEHFHMDVARSAALGEDGEDENEAVENSKKEGKRSVKRRDTHSEDRKLTNEEPNLIKTGLAVLEQCQGGAEFATPRTRQPLVDAVYAERCRSQGNSPPQLQTELGCRAKSNAVRVGDGGWRSAFGESPPKRKVSNSAEPGDLTGGSPPLPREIQALAQRLRQEQRPKLKAFTGEGSVVAAVPGGGRYRESHRIIPGVGKSSRSLPSLQRFGASRLPGAGTNPWPIGTGRSPRSPTSQRPSSTPCSMPGSWL